MEEAFGRPMTTEGQGGSIPLCNVLAETYPDAEIMLLGVEEPKCLIHAPNESVDPSEIEHIALAEALFLQNATRQAQAMSAPRPFTAEDFARRMARAAEQAEAAGLTGVLVDARARPRSTSPATRRSRSPSGSRCSSSRRHREPAMIVPILERPDAEARPSAATIALTRLDRRRATPTRRPRALLDPHGALRDLRLGLGDAAARPPAGAARARATSR